MYKQHSRSGEAHHVFDLLAHLRAIAVDGTSGTGGFTPPKGAALNPLRSIIIEALTIRTQLSLL